MHPILAPMIERNAYIGGCDGVAVVKSGEIIGEDPMGTMPHALIICIGSTVEAIKAYDEVLESKFKRVALIDTFLDEKFEALNVAEAMGKKLFGIRLDTPSSRRGDFYRILEEVKWELDLRGYKHVKLFVSGGIKGDIQCLIPWLIGGIGTSISNAPVVDFAMDIMDLEQTLFLKASGGNLMFYVAVAYFIVPFKNSIKLHKCRWREFSDILSFMKNKILQPTLQR